MYERAVDKARLFARFRRGRESSIASPPPAAELDPRTNSLSYQSHFHFFHPSAQLSTSPYTKLENTKCHLKQTGSSSYHQPTYPSPKGFHCHSHAHSFQLSKPVDRSILSQLLPFPQSSFGRSENGCGPGSRLFLPPSYITHSSSLCFHRVCGYGGLLGTRTVSP